MDVNDLGKGTGVVKEYNSSGLILDLYLSGKLSRADAESWARELKAEYPMQYLGIDKRTPTPMQRTPQR